MHTHTYTRFRTAIANRRCSQCGLLHAQSLLTDPNPDSPANVDAAKVSAYCLRSCSRYSPNHTTLRQLWRDDKKKYRRRVRKCAAKTMEC